MSLVCSCKRPSSIKRGLFGKDMSYWRKGLGRVHETCLGRGEQTRSHEAPESLGILDPGEIIRNRVEPTAGGISVGQMPRFHFTYHYSAGAALGPLLV